MVQIYFVSSESSKTTLSAMRNKTRKDKTIVREVLAIGRKEEKKSLHQQKKAQRKQYLFAIQELTGRELKRKYARSYLGVLWSILNPLLSMAVLSLIFSTMFRRYIDYYPLYYLTGQTIWSLFSTGTNSSMNALVDNKNLLIKGSLPRQIFVMSRIYTALVNFGYSCVAFVVLLLIFQIPPCWMMLLFPIIILLLLLFTMGIGYMLSILYVFFADIKYLYSIVLTLWLYMSAVFYPVDNLPFYVRTVVENNPLYLAIFLTRECVVYGNVPELLPFLKLVAWSIGSFGMGLFVFHKYQNEVMQRI